MSNLASMLEVRRARLASCLPSGAVDLLLNPGAGQSAVSHVCGAAKEDAIRCLQDALADLPIDRPIHVHVGVPEPHTEDSTDNPALWESIQQTILSRIEDVRGCYNDALALTPGLRGKITVKFIIGVTGAVLASQSLENETGDAELACCINHSLRLWDFPQPESCGIVVVTYPFVLQPEGGT